MEVIAKASHIPHSPRKVNLIAKAMVGKKAQEALNILEFTPKEAAGAVIKALRQAVANAHNNFKLASDGLYINEMFATKGRSWKKVRFAGRGRRRLYEKTTAHLTIKLISKEQPKVAAVKKTK